MWHKKPIEIFLRSTSVKLCTSDFMGFKKCRNLKNKVLITVVKVFIFFPRH